MDFWQERVRMFGTSRLLHLRCNSSTLALLLLLLLLILFPFRERQREETLLRAPES